MHNAEAILAAIELLRVKLKLQVNDMAEIFGVSRIAYYKWVRGGAIRPAHAAEVAVFLRKAVRVLKEQDFPTSAEARMKSADRAKRLLELMDLYD